MHPSHMTYFYPNTYASDNQSTHPGLAYTSVPASPSSNRSKDQSDAGTTSQFRKCQRLVLWFLACLVFAIPTALIVSPVYVILSPLRTKLGANLASSWLYRMAGPSSPSATAPTAHDGHVQPARTGGQAKSTRFAHPATAPTAAAAKPAAPATANADDDEEEDLADTPQGMRASNLLRARDSLYQLAHTSHGHHHHHHHSRASSSMRASQRSADSTADYETASPDSASDAGDSRPRRHHSCLHRCCAAIFCCCCCCRCRCCCCSCCRDRNAQRHRKSLGGDKKKKRVRFKPSVVLRSKFKDACSSGGGSY